MNEYRFFITHNSITTEVFPLFSSLRFAWKRSGYRYSKECKTQFTLRNDSKTGNLDFDLIYDIETGSERCEEIAFEIKRSCDKGATYSTYWEGYFSANKGTFNLDRCTFIFTPSVTDKYTCLESNKNVKVNILKSLPRVDIYSRHQDIISTIVYVTIDTGDPIPANSTLVYHVNSFNTDIYASEQATTDDVSGENVPPDNDSNWVMISSGGGQSVWARPFITNGVVFTTSVSPASDEAHIVWALSQPVTIADHYPYVQAINSSSIPANDGLYIALPLSYIETYYFPRFHPVYDTLLYLINEICPAINGIISDFFEWNPEGDAPDYSSGINYVTGNSNVVAKLAIAQKSDIIYNPTPPSNWATIGELSFQEYMDILCRIFNLDWFITDTGYFRIEHEKYFTYVVGYDATDNINSERNISNNEYSYRNEQMPERERFSFMESQGRDFVGLDIVYSNSCATPGEESIIDVNSITTDLNFIDNYPDRISKDGFVLVTYSADGLYNYVNTEVGELTGQSINNAHLSWANLHENYHRYGRVLLEGSMNGVDTTFETANPIKQQKNVKLLICCGGDFDPTGKLVQTELGLGEVESAEIENGIVTMQILL